MNCRYCRQNNHEISNCPKLKNKNKVNDTNPNYNIQPTHHPRLLSRNTPSITPTNTPRNIPSITPTNIVVMKPLYLNALTTVKIVEIKDPIELLQEKQKIFFNGSLLQKL